MFIRNIIQEDLVNKEVKVRIKKNVYNGIIKGSKLEYSIVFIKDLCIQFEITWDLAYRAVHNETVIEY